MIVDWYLLERVTNVQTAPAEVPSGTIDDPRAHLLREICRAITVLHGRLQELEAE
jgi:hypothetical protein